MTRYCLDTSAYGHFQRHSRTVELIDSAEFIGVPAVVVGELRAGFLLGSRTAQNASQLTEFLNHRCVSVIEVDLDVAKSYAQIFVALRKAGTPIPTNDIWVAASAMQVGAPVLTFDSDFALIQQVGSIVLETTGPDRS